MKIPKVYILQVSAIKYLNNKTLQSVKQNKKSILIIGSVILKMYLKGVCRHHLDVFGLLLLLEKRWHSTIKVEQTSFLQNVLPAFRYINSHVYRNKWRHAFPQQSIIFYWCQILQLLIIDSDHLTFMQQWHNLIIIANLKKSTCYCCSFVQLK